MILRRIGVHLAHNVIAYVALFVALGGSAYAATKWTGADIVDESLTAVDLAPGSAGTSEIADGAVGSADIANGGVAAADLDADSVSSPKVDNGSLTGADVQNDSLTGADIDESSLSLGGSGGGSGVETTTLQLERPTSVDEPTEGLLLSTPTVQVRGACQIDVIGGGFLEDVRVKNISSGPARLTILGGDEGVPFTDSVTLAAGGEHTAPASGVFRVVTASSVDAFEALQGPAQCSFGGLVLHPAP